MHTRVRKGSTTVEGPSDRCNQVVPALETFFRLPEPVKVSVTRPVDDGQGVQETGSPASAGENSQPNEARVVGLSPEESLQIARSRRNFLLSRKMKYVSLLDDVDFSSRVRVKEEILRSIQSCESRIDALTAEIKSLRADVKDPQIGNRLPLERPRLSASELDLLIEAYKIELGRDLSEVEVEYALGDASLIDTIPIIESSTFSFADAFVSLPFELKEHVVSFIDPRSAVGRLARLSLQCAQVTDSELKARMLYRLSKIERKEARDDVVFSRRLPQSSSKVPITLHDPTRPSWFRSKAMAVGLNRKRLEKLYSDLTLLTAEVARTGEDDAMIVGINREMDKLITEQKEQLDLCYRLFASSIGMEPTPTAAYNKSVINDLTMQALGVTGRPGTGRFDMRGHGLGRVLDLNCTLDAARMFSLYMCKKGFQVVDPRGAAGETEKFLSRAQRPASVPDPLRLYALKCLAVKIAREFFRRCPRHSSYKECKGSGCDLALKPRPPNSGKGCIENPRSKGGKRAYLYSGGEPWAKGYTRVDTIYTGGKFRTICVPSVDAERFAFLNSFMLNALRGCKWLISGRSVADWVHDCLNGEEDLKNPLFCSGDLQTATDLLNREIAESIIDVLADQFPDIGTSDEMKAYVTRCKYAEFDSLSHTKTNDLGTQQNGQSMASDFSFPILCICSFLISVETLGLADDLLVMPTFTPANKKTGEKARRPFRESVRGLNRIGVNGDDQVVIGDAERDADLGERWIKSVRKLSGVPEPSKSPLSGRYFTVNSELWVYDRDTHKAHEVGSLLPSQILSLHAGVHKDPDQRWINMFESPLLTPWAQDILHLDLCLLPDMPLSWGGLNLVRPKYDLLWFKRALYSKESRQVNYMEMHETIDSWDGVSSHNGHFTFVHNGREISSRPVQGRIRGFVNQQWFKELMYKRFFVNDIIHWSNPRTDAPHPYQLIKLISGRVAFDARQTRRSMLHRVGGRSQLHQAMVEEAALTSIYEKKGMIFVSSLAYAHEDELAGSDFVKNKTFIGAYRRLRSLKIEVVNPPPEA